MTRDDVWNLVHGRLGDSATWAHCLACEACMRALARKFGEDEDLWGMTGLAHDLDLDECADDPGRHAIVGAGVLAENGAPEDMVDAVLGHNDKAIRATMLARALWVVDPTTGMITASALIRPSKSTSDLNLKSLKKRMKDKRFAAAVNRDQIHACTEQLGLEFDEFLEICLVAMDGVRDRIGLGGI